MPLYDVCQFTLPSSSDAIALANDGDCIDVCAVLTDRATLLVAYINRNNDLHIVHGTSTRTLRNSVGKMNATTSLIPRPPPRVDRRDSNSNVDVSAVDDDTKVQISKLRYTDDPEETATCACFSPSGQWLVIMLRTGRILIVPTQLVIGEKVTAEWQDAGAAPLFAPSEIAYISVKTREDGLHTPTACLWYETQHARRPMLIFSNKGGDILFVDLLIRKLSVCLQAPQSIHNLSIVHSANSVDTSLLVTGFAATQWLVPLETEGSTVRETLSRIVPADLKELQNEGTIQCGTVNSQHFVAVHDRENSLFKVCPSVRLIDQPTRTICLRADVIHVFYTPQMALQIDAESKCYITMFMDSAETNPAIEHARKLLNTQIGELTKDARIHAVHVLQFTRKQYEMPEFVVVTERGVHYVTAKFTLPSLVCLLAKALDAEFRSPVAALCNTFSMPLTDTAIASVRQLLTMSPSTSSAPAHGIAMRIVNVLQLPMPLVAPLFISFGHGKLILPLLLRYIKEQQTETTAGALTDCLRLLSVSAFNVAVQVLLASDGYERSVHEHNLCSLLTDSGTLLDRGECIDRLLNNELWTCLLSLVGTYGQSLPIILHLTSMQGWRKESEEFTKLLTHPSIALLYKGHPKEVTSFIRRLTTESVTNLHNTTHIKMVVEMTRVDSEIMKELAGMSDRESASAALYTSIVELHLLSVLQCIVKENKDVDPIASTSSSSPFEHDMISSIDECPLAAGANHTVMLGRHGVYAWGKADKREVVGLPHGGKDDKLLLTLPHCITLPSALTLSNVVALAAGAEHTLLLTRHGELYAFGRNTYGQLGDGTTEHRSIAVKVLTGQHRIVSIACGHYHSCCVTSEGQAMTWGWSVHGQLGHGSRALHDHLVPTVVTVRSSSSSPSVRYVGAGHSHTVFVTMDGHVFTCGSGVFGQLGRGVRIKAKCVVPTMVSLNQGKVVRLGVGQFNTIVWTEDGRLLTWGCTPQSLKLRALIAKRARKVDKEDVLNGMTRATAVDKIVKEGGIAADTGMTHMSPVELDLPTALENNAAHVTRISCGANHAALTTAEGQLFTWGKSNEHQLGHGDKKERMIPWLLTSVKGGVKWTHVSCGLEYTMACTEKGDIYGWGRDDLCQLGFEHMPTTCQSPMAGRTLTIGGGRGGKTPRTITLPRDGRLSVTMPTKLIALRTVHTEEPSTSSDVIAPSIFMSLCLDRQGDYDVDALVDACSGLNAERLAAYAMLVNGRTLQVSRPNSITCHCKAITRHASSLTSRLSEAQLCDVLRCYEDCISRETDVGRRRELLHAILNEFMHATSIDDLEEYLRRKLVDDHWMEMLCDVLHSRPISMRHLSAYFKIDLLHALLWHKRATATSSSSPPTAVHISGESIASALHDGSITVHSFPQCKHDISENTLQAQLGRLQSEQQITSQLPKTTALVLEHFTSAADHPSLCPQCLHVILAGIAHDIV